MKLPTEKQKELLAAVHRLTKLCGYPPTRREIADELGLTGLNGISEQLERLEASGCLQIAPRIARGLTLTARGRSFL